MYQRLRHRLRAPLLILVLLLLPFCPLAAEDAADPDLDRIRTAIDEHRYAVAMRDIRALVADRRHAEAEEVAWSLLQSVEAEHGAHSLEAAEVLDLLVESRCEGGRVREPETLELAKEALRIKENLLTAADIRLADTLFNLGLVFDGLRDLEKARGHLERALEIREDILGREHPDVASVLHEIGRVSYYADDLDRAKQVLERAVHVREGSHGPVHPDLATSLRWLAWTYMKRGDGCEKAMPLHQRAVEVRRAAFGPDSSRVEVALAGVSTCLFTSGQYARAEAVDRERLRIREKVYGVTSPRLISVINAHLWVNLVRLGDQAGAAELVERSVAIIDEARRTGTPLRALDVSITAAGVSALVGDRELVVRLTEMALEIIDSKPPRSRRHTSVALSSAASALMLVGDYERAEPILESLLDNEKGAYRTDPFTLDALAELAIHKRQYEEARGLLERSRRIFEGLRGPRSGEVSRTVLRLAEIAWDTGDYQEARQLALEAEEVIRRGFRSSVRWLPERRALEYASHPISGLDLALSAVARGDDPEAPCLKRVWDAVIRARATVLDEMAARQHAVIRSGELAPRFEDVVDKRTRLANLTLRGPGRRSIEEHEAMLDRLRNDVEQAEAALARLSAPFRRAQEREAKRNRVGFDEIAVALPHDAALVAYKKYGLQPRGRSRKVANAGLGSETASDDKKRADTTATSGLTPSYAAFVLGPGAEAPAVVFLGSADPIDALVARWRSEAGSKPAGTKIAARRSEGSYRDVGAALRRAVWEPVVERVPNAQRLFVVPDGALNLISFGALPGDGDQYLVETGPLIHYLSAERDLVQERLSEQTGRGLMALGAPDFDRAPGLALSAVSALAETAFGTLSTAPSGETFRGSTPRCASFDSLVFDTLPFARTELDEIVSLWKEHGTTQKENPAIKLVGAAADEAVFKELASRHEVIHVATHAFLLQGLCPSATESAARTGSAARSSNDLLAAAAGENPLLLSGLALAGANRRESSPEDRDDGILTAQEIASLDLSGVDWVVLSACATGVGKVVNGEGVFGLRRAFEVAGADTLIMSLWAVQDDATRDWMRALYESRLAGESTAGAMRSASLAVLAARRRAGQSTHPFYWASFVAAGDWR